MPTKNKLVIKHGYLATDNSEITGSLIVTAGVTGSLLGTASNATLAADSTRLGGVVAASYALNTGLTGFATTGSNTFVGNQNVTGNVTVTGILTANTYIVSSSLTNMTVAYASGSTSFGNSSDDTHLFTGSLQISGSVTAASFSGNGSGLTGVTATAIFPTSAVTNITSTDKFFISQSANEYITYGNLLTDLAGTNLTVEASDSLTLASNISGLNSVSSTTFTGSYVDASTYVNVGAVAKTFAGQGTFTPSSNNNIISVDPNTYPHNAIHVKYVLWNTTGTAYADMRAGTIMIVRNNTTTANIAESTTQDIGDTSVIDFTVNISGTTDIVMDSSAYAQSVIVKYEYTLL